MHSWLSLSSFVMVTVFREVCRSSNFVLLKQWPSIHQVLFWFPGVLGCGVSFPFDQEGVTTRLPSVSKDHFHFVFFFSVY